MLSNGIENGFLGGLGLSGNSLGSLLPFKLQFPAIYHSLFLELVIYRARLLELLIFPFQLAYLLLQHLFIISHRAQSYFQLLHSLFPVIIFDLSRQSVSRNLSPFGLPCCNFCVLCFFLEDRAILSYEIGQTRTNVGVSGYFTWQVRALSPTP